MDDSRPDDILRGLELRYALCVTLLDARTSLTIPELIERLETRGFVLRGRQSKTVSDALRWEVRRDRVRRVGRGSYASGSMPRSTERWIRRRARQRRQRIVAPTLSEA
jgi:hypothetical protein